ncbi:hypothetical protein JZ751_014735 [Albula glossodonta]|uniref:Selenocysteine-specific elongation factor C-terminal RIFT domain-containing protein n=1 Tax=Albula glossodonta TaxID=121402 RepID=A0A8T2N814_9TELE|nr:hypothetical protein JZ751_014735 [Albula glossodonta]
MLHAPRVIPVTDDYTVIGRNLFKKETNLQLFVGLKVRLSTGEQGVIEGGFGQSGKFKIRVPVSVLFSVLISLPHSVVNVRMLWAVGLVSHGTFWACHRWGVGGGCDDRVCLPCTPLLLTHPSPWACLAPSLPCVYEKECKRGKNGENKREGGRMGRAFSGHCCAFEAPLPSMQAPAPTTPPPSNPRLIPHKALGPAAWHQTVIQAPRRPRYSRRLKKQQLGGGADCAVQVQTAPPRPPPHSLSYLVYCVALHFSMGPSSLSHVYKGLSAETKQQLTSNSKKKTKGGNKTESVKEEEPKTDSHPIGISLSFKRYIFDPHKKMVQS